MSLCCQGLVQQNYNPRLCDVALCGCLPFALGKLTVLDCTLWGAKGNTKTQNSMLLGVLHGRPWIDHRH